MKAVKILLSEDLLTELDETAEAREQGRSAVLRQLVSDFLRQHRERELDAQYERAYKEGDSPLGEDFEGWEDASSEEQIRQIEEGLREADAGDFASDEEVAAVFARWTETPVIPSSGNVFADLGFAEPEEEVAKTQLASHIRRIIRRRRQQRIWNRRDVPVRFSTTRAGRQRRDVSGGAPPPRNPGIAGAARAQSSTLPETGVARLCPPPRPGGRSGVPSEETSRRWWPARVVLKRTGNVSTVLPVHQAWIQLRQGDGPA